MSTLGWLTTSLVELLLFVMVLTKAELIDLSKHNPTEGSGVVAMMARDSTWYFGT